jgi:hypothetical protein
LKLTTKTPGHEEIEAFHYSRSTTMRRKLYPTAFFLVVTILAFWKVIFHGEFTLLIGGDVASAYYPWFDVASYWLKKGIFILWDPYVYAGKPFMGEPQPGLFYPLNWIFMLLPARGGGINLDGLQTLLILNYFLIGCFTFLLARSIGLSPYGAAAAGVSFALGGYTVHIFGYVNKLSGFVWMPLVILCFRRALLTEHWKARVRWGVWGGIGLALTFLPGHHIPAIHTGLFLFFYAVFTLVRDWKSPWKARTGILLALAVVAVTGVLITTFQWLPASEWARVVYRWIGDAPPVAWGQKVPYSELQHGGNIAPQDVVSLLIPYFGARTSLYVGCVVLFLALVGLLFARQRETWFFRSAAFLYLFLSWGYFSALHGWINTLIPGVWFAREVFHYLIPFQLSLALLAGWGLDYLVDQYSGVPAAIFNVFVRRAGWGIALLVLFSGMLVVVLHFRFGMGMDHPYITGMGALATYLSVLGFLIFLLHTRSIRPSVFRGLIVALVVLDLSSQLSSSLPGKERTPEEQNTYVRNTWKKGPAVEFLRGRREAEYFRVDDPSQVFPPNFGDVWRVESTMGHGATALVDYFAFRGTGWGPASNASALLNVRYFPSPVAIPGMKKIFEDGDAVYQNPRAVDRVFVASSYRAFSTREQILGWLSSSLLAPRETVLLLEQDLSQVPEWFWKEARNESDGIEIRRFAQRSASEKKALLVEDELERHKLNVFRPAWGVSAGDELAILFRPDQPLEHCFVIFSLSAAPAEKCGLTLTLRGPQGVTQIPVELVASSNQELETERPRRAVLDLGRVDRADHHLSFEKTEACRPWIDSLRIAKSVPREEEPGTVRIVSYEPNRMTLAGELRRASFVVLSEVFYPGWEALVDGRPAPIIRGDLVLRAIPVSAGKHTIELRFRPKTLFWGLAVSITSMIGVALFLLLTRDR